MIVLLLTYLLIALILSYIPVKKETDTDADIRIYILTNGMHTDIVMPISNNLIDWSEEIKFENTSGKKSNYSYIAVGWGDKAFYLETPEWSDLKVGTAFKATFGLSQSAIHTTFHRQITEDEDCKAIDISEDEYKNLIEFIQKSFARDSNGNIELIDTDAVYGQSDNFYEGVGRYSLFNTCNSWANRGLKTSGQKACLWTPFSFGIFLHYE